jgi:hypothetical protein
MDGRAVFHEFTWEAAFEEARRNATGLVCCFTWLMDS